MLVSVVVVAEFGRPVVPWTITEVQAEEQSFGLWLFKLVCLTVFLLQVVR